MEIFFSATAWYYWGRKIPSLKINFIEVGLLGLNVHDLWDFFDIPFTAFSSCCPTSSSPITQNQWRIRFFWARNTFGFVRIGILISKKRHVVQIAKNGKYCKFLHTKLLKTKTWQKKIIVEQKLYVLETSAQSWHGQNRFQILGKKVFVLPLFETVHVMFHFVYRMSKNRFNLNTLKASWFKQKRQN